MGGNGGTVETALSSFSFSSFFRRIQMFAQASKTLSGVRKQIAFLLHSRKEKKIPANTWLGERRKEGKLPNEISRYNGRNVSQVGEEESSD